MTDPTALAAPAPIPPSPYQEVDLFIIVVLNAADNAGSSSTNDNDIDCANGFRLDPSDIAYEFLKPDLLTVTAFNNANCG
jgi:hypothetical protein